MICIHCDSGRCGYFGGCNGDEKSGYSGTYTPKEDEEIEPLDVNYDNL